MRITFISLLIATVLALAETTAQAEDHRKPICFTNELAAFTNGSTVLTAITTSNYLAKARIESLIGSRVLFDGDNSKVPSTNADLNLGKGVILRVELNPQRDILPKGPMWRAEVVGILRSVDFERRVIHITARPEEWQAFIVR